MRQLPLLLLLFLLALPARAQEDPSRAETERRLRELREQIEADQRRLSQTVEAEQVSVSTLQNIERQIATREALVNTYGQRAQELTSTRDSLAQTLGALSSQLARLRAQYHQRARHAYKHGRTTDLALILSSGSINQMVRRVRYLRRFAEQRRRRLGAIEAAADALSKRQAQIAAAASQSQRMLAEASSEQRNLQGLRQNRERVVRELRWQRTTIEADLRRKRQAAQQLEARIRSLVAAENARRRERDNPAEEAAFSALSGEFAQNRGRMPWPAPGVIVEPFGDVVNPVYGTTTPNPGVLIGTTAGAEVRAVFEGTVSRVDAMPEYGTFVLIQHGDYQSLYSNFSSVSVRAGQRVTAGQVLGRAGTESQPKGAGVFFALFREGNPVNPAQWLQPR